MAEGASPEKAEGDAEGTKLKGRLNPEEAEGVTGTEHGGAHDVAVAPVAEIVPSQEKAGRTEKGKAIADQMDSEETPFKVGERVSCSNNRGKNHRSAEVVDWKESRPGWIKYYVHYIGSDKRLDEWLPWTRVEKLTRKLSEAISSPLKSPSVTPISRADVGSGTSATTGTPTRYATRGLRRQLFETNIFPKAMDTEIEEVKQEIRKVQQEIDDVEGQLTKAATEAEVAYLRKEEEQLWKEEDQLRKKEEQLREEKLLLRKAHTSGLSSGVPEKLLQDLTEYLAEKKAKRKSKKSVCLSSVSQSIWGALQRQERLEMIFKDIGSKPKRLSDLPAFGWDDRLERSQADRYIVHLNKIKSGQKWKLIDAANKHPTLLSGFFGGWNFKGTTDVAFVHRVVSITGERRGLKCIFELKKDLRGGGDKAVIRTVICLLMANVSSRQFKPCAVLTDLHDIWSLYWMDGSKIYWYTFESRASAVGYIEELLQDSDDNEMGTSEALPSYARPHGEDEDLLQFIKKRRMYDPPEMDNLKDLVGLIPDEEILSARAQLAVQQLLQLPLFSGADVDVPLPSNMHR